MGWGFKRDAKSLNKMLVDTSVWIDALNGKKNRQTKFLSKMIAENGIIFICPTILQEILQGIRDDKSFKEVSENLEGFEVLELNGVKAALGAAKLYREIRKQGVTIRKSNDCLIAFYAIFYDVPLLHNDRDFDLISKHSSLKVC